MISIYFKFGLLFFKSTYFSAQNLKYPLSGFSGLVMHIPSESFKISLFSLFGYVYLTLVVEFFASFLTDLLADLVADFEDSFFKYFLAGFFGDLL